MKEELLKGLTPEQIEKVKACKGQEELLKLAKQEGIELTSDQLEAVSGGCGSSMPFCPRCDAPESRCKRIYNKYPYDWRCKDCGYEWEINTRNF